MFRTRDYGLSAKWYVKTVETTQDDESGEYDGIIDHPVYQLQAKMAELYLSGGLGLDKDPNYSG